MLDELTKSIKANLYERAVSPLFGTFVVSWVIWNYKFLFVLGSSMEVQEKFEYIEYFIYTDALACLLYFLIYPLITTTAFIFLYPYPSKYVYEYWHRRQKELKEIKQKIDDETPLTVEESRAIRRELLKLESEYDEEITRKESEINKLKDIVKEFENELNSLQKNNIKNQTPRKVTPRKVTAKKSNNDE
ncbi:MAG: hypothetical protein ABW080_17545 [Candidatus Thiodiazotropha sp.]